MRASKKRFLSKLRVSPEASVSNLRACERGFKAQGITEGLILAAYVDKKPGAAERIECFRP